MSSKHMFVENNMSDQDYNINQNTIFFPFFHDLSPSHPIPSILVGHTTFCISPYLPAFFFSAWYLCLQHPFPNIATISPVHMSTPPQPHLSSFVSKLLYPITKAL